MGLELSKNYPFRIRESHSLRLRTTQIYFDSNKKMYQVLPGTVSQFMLTL